MASERPSDGEALPLEQQQRINRVCDRFEEAWRLAPPRPVVEEHLRDVCGEDLPHVLLALLRMDVEYRRRHSEPVCLEDYAGRFPDYHRLIEEAVGERFTQVQAQPGRPEGGPPVAEVPVMPRYVGRYRVEGVLGAGGFGVVYLAYDEQLERRVAVKVPHRRLVARPEDAEPYLAEARAVAGLDHPHIVPVYDAGGTEEFPCFVVSKFIDGRTLAQRIQESRPSTTAAVELVATVAEALQHAHKQGLVHRDVKPGNILLDAAGKPYVADFGLALREAHVGHGPGFVGTPAYMSPEQARGEGHRVDGRSDVFSLGVVFYELLTGRRPFHGESRAELLEQISTLEARPPRQWDDTIPRELERICLKALAKRASERYTTARDLADDLQHFLAQPRDEGRSSSGPAAAAAGGATPVPAATPAATPVPTPTSGGEAIRIVPKGLRSFDAHDADFFLELLPGPRDREGLPDSIRFWKTRIEETDPDATFTVGLIYGPSGCGKTSLVKAGLLPRLSGHVLAVYVEATGEDTEARLLRGLRKRCPELPAELGLRESLAALRRGQGVAAGQKVLIVLDQFEQWLHARKDQENTELVQALRQCDGGRVQCVVMVRDDFWLAVGMFLKELEVRLLEGENSGLVPLFDPDHARKVLAALGRAFGRLPENPGEASKEQREFLGQAVAGLSPEGKVVCVRLALFAEMMKGRPWTPATLRDVGGAEGVGAAFLEETFSAATAPPEHRYHQAAARAVLKALLPETGSELRGHLRSEGELRTASGYSGRLRDFEDLIRLLDGELRLITPTDPEGREAGTQAESGQAGKKYYQLTHDYLVPSLREWLTRKQKESRRGRAELLLADRAAVWNTQPENRQLPSLVQWLQIRALTRPANWTEKQHRMMRRAARVHLGRAVAAVACVLVLLGVGWEVRGRLRAEVLRDRLLEATTEDVPAVVRDMGPYRRWLDGPLRQARAEAEAGGDARKQLHASLALLPVDPSQVPYLVERMLAGSPQEVLAIREELQQYGHAGGVTEDLWAVLENAADDPGRCLRAACALATYAPEDGRWEKVRGDVAARLAVENPLVVGAWAGALDGVGRTLLPPLADLLSGEGRGAAERRTIVGLYGRYAGDDAAALGPLEEVLGQDVAAGARKEDRVTLARRQANAAVALAALGRWEKLWPLLRHGPDPTQRSLLIDRLGPGGAEARALVERLAPGAEPDASVRLGVLLALGEYDEERLSRGQREALLPDLLKMYRSDPDSGVHGAAGWLLRQWGQEGEVAKVDGESRERDRCLGRDGGPPEQGRQWYVNGQGQTMVIVPPRRFEVIAPDESGQPVKVQVGQRFALAAREVSVAEFLRFRKDHMYLKTYAPTDDCPVLDVTCFDAAAYCNWLNRQEGIPEDQWCYLPNEKGQYGFGMKLAADWRRRSGYRLPTEEEWEYACRAGSATTWSMGDAEELLERYAWYNRTSLNRAHPGGVLRPNGLGLFDLHGNVWEWCQSRLDPSGRGIQSIADKEYMLDTTYPFPVRGGSFFLNALYASSFARDKIEPGYSSISNLVGFRPARTCR